jgi:hypothetical protein
MSSNPVYGEGSSTQHYVINFISDLLQFGGYHPILSPSLIAILSPTIFGYVKTVSMLVSVKEKTMFIIDVIQLLINVSPIPPVALKVTSEGSSTQHYVINFISDLLQFGGFLRVLRFQPPIKLTATIYLKYC